jgi:mono/diheme cytochrome c family protein
MVRERGKRQSRCVVLRVLCVTVLVALVVPAGNAQVTTDSPAVTSPAANGKALKPVERADATPAGKLKNPYQVSDAAIVKSGAALFVSAACSGCHGGTGGGGICPPLTDGVWIYGGDDDTLFRLVAYGSQTLQSKGYTRKAEENVVAPMPAMGAVVASDDDLWRILTFIRAQYHGPAECQFGCPKTGDRGH